MRTTTLRIICSSTIPLLLFPLAWLGGWELDRSMDTLAVIVAYFLMAHAVWDLDYWDLRDLRVSSEQEIKKLSKHNIELWGRIETLEVRVSSLVKEKNKLRLALEIERNHPTKKVQITNMVDE